MTYICLYFQVHHPVNYQSFRFLDIGKSKSYSSDHRNELEITDAVKSSYLPANKHLLQILHKNQKHFKLTFCFSGPALNQFIVYSPEVIDSFADIASTGQVEIAGGTLSHSIASLSENKGTFRDQIRAGKQLVEEMFNLKPGIFANTDLIFTDKIVKPVSKSGYRAMITNGAEKILHGASPNRIYCAPSDRHLKLLFRNQVISDAFTACINQRNDVRQAQNTFFSLLNSIPTDDPLVNIYLNYNNLTTKNGEHTLENFTTCVDKIIESARFTFSLPSELLENYGPVAEVKTETPVCWCEQFHPMYFPGNELQKEAIRQLFKLSDFLKKCHNPDILADWNSMQTSDHFHLMDENHPSYRMTDPDKQVFRSKYDAFINFMNILEDFRLRLKNDLKKRKLKQKAAHPGIWEQRIYFNK